MFRSHVESTVTTVTAVVVPEGDANLTEPLFKPGRVLILKAGVSLDCSFKISDVTTYEK